MCSKISTTSLSSWPIIIFDIINCIKVSSVSKTFQSSSSSSSLMLVMNFFSLPWLSCSVSIASSPNLSDRKCNLSSDAHLRWLRWLRRGDIRWECHHSSHRRENCEHCEFEGKFERIEIKAKKGERNLILKFDWWNDREECWEIDERWA